MCRVVLSSSLCTRRILCASCIHSDVVLRTRCREVLECTNVLVTPCGKVREAGFAGTCDYLPCSVVESLRCLNASLRSRLGDSDLTLRTRCREVLVCTNVLVTVCGKVSEAGFARW